MTTLFKIFQVLAVLGLSCVSIYTTAVGLTFLMPLPAAWVAAAAIQVVLVGAAYQARAAFSNASARAAVYVTVYAAAAAFSISGSFVAYDQVFSGARRVSEDQTQLRGRATDFVTTLRAEST